MKYKLLGYTLFIIASLVLSIYFRFPGQTLADYIEANSSGIDPKLEISIDRLKPSFPPGIKAESVQLHYAGNPFAELDNFSFLIDLGTLAGKNISCSFETRALEGRLSGNVLVAKENHRNIRLQSRFERLMLEKIDTDSILPNCGISGIISGNLNGELDKLTLQKSRGKFDLKNLALHFKEPLFSVNNYSFSETAVAFAMPDPKTIEVQECTMKGRQMDIESSGKIHLSENMKQSTLDINARVVLYPLFFMDAGDDIPADISNSRSENAVFNLKIGGTVNNPSVSFDKEKQ